MDEFTLYKEDVKDYLAQYNVFSFNHHKEIVLTIARLNKAHLHTETHKKLSKKLNVLIMDNLFINGDNNVIAYFIKIKKLDITLRVKSQFMSKLLSIEIKNKEDMFNGLKKVDLFLQTFHYEDMKKDELLDKYIAKQKERIKNSYLPNQYSLEVLEQYQSHRERKKFELLLNTNKLTNSKMKI